MCVKIGEQHGFVAVRVVDGTGPSRLGGDIMCKLSLPWEKMFNVVSIDTDDIIRKCPDLFDRNTLGKLKGVQVTLKIQNDNPAFMKAGTIPFAIRERFDQVLDKLEKDGVNQKVQHSEWASPTMPVIKPDGRLWICGDYSGPINKNSQLE